MERLNGLEDSECRISGNDTHQKIMGLLSIVNK